MGRKLGQGVLAIRGSRRALGPRQLHGWAHASPVRVEACLWGHESPLTHGPGGGTTLWDGGMWPRKLLSPTELPPHDAFSILQGPLRCTEDGVGVGLLCRGEEPGGALAHGAWHVRPRDQSGVAVRRDPVRYAPHDSSRRSRVHLELCCPAWVSRKRSWVPSLGVYWRRALRDLRAGSALHLPGSARRNLWRHHLADERCRRSAALPLDHRRSRPALDLGRNQLGRGQPHRGGIRLPTAWHGDGRGYGHGRRRWRSIHGIRTAISGRRCSAPCFHGVAFGAQLLQVASLPLYFLLLALDLGLLGGHGARVARRAAPPLGSLRR